MSDRTIRALERRAAAGDTESAGELLLARHRLGELAEVRLRFAAHLGDPGAEVARARLLNVAPRKQRLGTWIRALGVHKPETWGDPQAWRPLVHPLCVRVALAAAEQGLEVWGSPGWAKGVEDEDADTRVLRETLRATTQWLQGPSAEQAEVVWRRVESARVDGIPTIVAVEVASAVRQVSSISRPSSREREIARSAADVVEHAARALGWEHGKKPGEALLRGAIRAVCVPWLLAEG